MLFHVRNCKGGDDVKLSVYRPKYLTFSLQNRRVSNKVFEEYNKGTKLLTNT